MKTGRNDSCPCGSGKKYKKCCLEKDRLEENDKKSEALSIHPEIDEWESENESFFDSWGKTDAPEKEEEYDYDVKDEAVDGDQLFIDADKLPDLPEEDKKLVDDWWEEYGDIVCTVTEREHLVRFIDAYPHLVEHLGLHWEVLFELGAAHYKNGIYDTYVDLLLRMRKEFPNVYIKSFGYYDADLIYWYVAQGRIDEISPFFDLFKQEKGWEFNDKLADIVVFFNAINRSDIILSELAQNPKTKELIVAERINHTVSRYIDRPVSEETVNLLMQELAADGIPQDISGDFNHFYKRLLHLNRPFTVWDDNVPQKRSEALDCYVEITDNFSVFLYKKIGLSLESAELYGITV
jgi:hypothetical protein